MTYKNWRNEDHIKEKSYICFYCDKSVGADRGYAWEHPSGLRQYIYICPNCSCPTFIDTRKTQYPSPSFGDNVQSLPEHVEKAYKEAREAFSANAYTASALMCRKILMNVAVSKGAPENKRFIEYVEWLQSQNFIPPGSADWIDVIRQKGNEATHEIPAISQEDAEELIAFCELLLKFIFEFPARSAKYNTGT